MIPSQNWKIRYSQSWEDADLLLKALALHSYDNVFSITSGGCNTLALASQPISSLLAVDINPAQSALLELKLKAIHAFDYDTLLGFIGVRKSEFRKELYNKLSGDLSAESDRFWKNHLNCIREGIIHCGKFERYLQIFRRYVLSLVHSGKTINELLTLKAEPEQLKFFNNKWDSFRWRMLFRLFFSRSVMQWLGRSPEMFRYTVKERISDHYLTRTRKAFTSEILFDNSYIEYILRGNYTHSLPYYLRQDVVGMIQANRVPAEICTGHILDILKGLPGACISKFNLSDVFEPLSENEANLIFSEILRTGTNGARLIFWNNLVRRNVNKELASCFRREEELEMQLKPQEKVFFYEDVNIYTLVK